MAAPITLTFLIEAALGADLTANPATWVWTDITRYVRGAITVTRGRPDRANGQPTQFGFRLANNDYRFTPGHPLSTNFGQWGLGTPVRAKLNPGTGLVVRGQGYVDTLVPTWPSGNSDQAEVIVNVSGALRRLSQGAVLRSPLYQSTTAAAPTCYWPLEDGAGAAAAVGTTSTLLVSGSLSFGSTLITGASSAVDLSGGGRLSGPIVGSFSATGWQVEFSGCYQSSTPGAPATLLSIFTTTYTGGLGVVMSQDMWDGRPHHVSVWLAQSGSDVIASSYHDGVLFSTTTFTSLTLGIPTILTVNVYSLTDGTVPDVGHVAFYSTFSNPAARAAAAIAYLGEVASARVSRLCAESTVAVTVTGTSSVTMGEQPLATLVDLLRECEDADQGVLRDGLSAGIDYLAGPARSNPTVALALDAARRQVKLPFGPIEDDSRIRNDVTASRSGGTSARYVDSDPRHTKSTVKAGVYDDHLTVNVPTDQALFEQASWRVRLGTFEEMRVPTTSINLLDTPELIASWLACDLGSRYTGTNLPVQYPPGGIDQVLEYYVEVFEAIAWMVDLTGSPARLWRAYIFDDAVNPFIFDSDDSTLSVGVSATATTLSIASVAALWSTGGGDYPLDIGIAGEQITVTAMVGGASPQTATVIRAVNGVSKAHLAGEQVALWQSPTFSL